MSASGRVTAELRRSPRPIRLLGASGQLGYGIPTASFRAGVERKPDLSGCDMGSIDIGPTYLGKGEMATSPEATRRDLRRVLQAARALDVPLVIGSAGSAGISITFWMPQLPLLLCQSQTEAERSFSETTMPRKP